MSTKKIALTSMICAFSYVLMVLSKMIPSVAGFLQYDLKDIAIVIGGYLLGPVSAIIATIIVSFLEFITVSHTGWIGLIMNIISTGSFCFVACFVYYKKRNIFFAILGLVLASLALTTLMVLWNYYITPLYMKVPREVVKTMLPTVFIPFNLAKGFINSGLILLLYRPVSVALSKSNIIANVSAKKTIAPSIIVGVILILVFLPLLLSIM